jgi:lipoprotein signal peptidase
VLRRAALPATGLYPLAAIAVCVLAFAAGQGLHASGFLATYVSGLVLGNSRLPHRGDTLSFAEGLGWLGEISLFVLLGLYVSPSRLPEAVIPALVVGAVLIVLARPLSVLLALTPLRVSWREQMFLSWSGLRGVVPIVLALVALTMGFPGAQLLADVVFVLVVLLTVVQGVTLPVVVRWLRLSQPEQGSEIQVDFAPLDQMDAELLQIRVPRPSRLHGVYLSELRLPPGTMVSLVVRDGVVFTPEPTTRLEEGDQLLVVTTAGNRDVAERRIRAVHRAGRLAAWRGETGEAAAAGDQRIPEVPPGRRRTGLLAATAAGALLLDVLSKIAVVAVLEGRPPVELLGGGLYLIVYRNAGAAFSMATGFTWLLSLIALGVVVAIVRLAPRLRSTGWALGLGLVLGGALGNLVDRLLRTPGPLRGHVVDFLSLLAPDGSVWPVFNLADSAIVSGGVLLVVLSLLGLDYDGSTTRQRRAVAGPPS